MASLRSIDSAIEGSSSTLIDTTILPLHCDEIPSSVTCLAECAMHEVQKLLEKSNLSQDDEDALDDGFVLCDLRVIQKKLVAWRRMFPRVKPFFAVKCNPDIMVASVLGQQSDEVGFDCASLSEIKLALKSTNGNSRRCIYANPQRAQADLEEALSLGVEALTFDGSEELYKVYRAHQKRCNGSERPPPEMILRILVPDATSSVPLGEKFGAPPSRIEPLIHEAVELGLPIIGVSFHCGSGCHDPEAYENAIRLAKDAIDTMNRIQNDLPRLLDIGGGFPGIDGAGGDLGRFCRGDKENVHQRSADQQESTADIAAAVVPLLDDLFPENKSPVQIISEPGRYFVEAAFAVCSRIYSTRDEFVGEQPRRHYYIAQGVHGVFKDVLLCNESFVPIPLQMEQSDPGEEADPSREDVSYRSTVHGPSGEQYDVVCRDCLLPPLHVGDWLIFDRMGAYTLSIAARSGNLPVRYVMGGFDHRLGNSVGSHQAQISSSLLERESS